MAGKKLTNELMARLEHAIKLKEYWKQFSGPNAQYYEGVVDTLEQILELTK